HVGAEATEVLVALLGIDGRIADLVDDQVVDAPDDSTTRAVWRTLGHIALIGRLRASFPGAAWAIDIATARDTLAEVKGPAARRILAMIDDGAATFPADPDRWGGPITRDRLASVAASWEAGGRPSPPLEPSSAAAVSAAVPHEAGPWITRMAERDDGVEVATSVAESWAILAVESSRRALHATGPDTDAWWRAAEEWWTATVAAWSALDVAGDRWAGGCADESHQRLKAVHALRSRASPTSALPSDPGPAFAFESAPPGPPAPPEHASWRSSAADRPSRSRA
ncbi:MAG TPA: hypothetical protein VGO60_09615, partial [Iamia sp.]|nr:hypothetical protein [Iamia sp.]